MRELLKYIELFRENSLIKREIDKMGSVKFIQ